MALSVMSLASLNITTLLICFFCCCHSKRWQRSSDMQAPLQNQETEATLSSGNAVTAHPQEDHHAHDLLKRLAVLLFAPAVSLHTRPISGTASPGKAAARSYMADANEDDRANAKKPWEFQRFLRTVSFYGGFRPRIPILSDVISGFQRQGRTRALQPQDRVWSSQAANGMVWGPLDDVVMGGASRSNLEPGEAFTGTWRGTVTTANNGGFVGIRTKPFETPLDLSACRGFDITVEGDGQRYKFIVRDDEDWNGITWAYSFTTIAKKGKAQNVKIPFSAFTPTKYARTVSGRQLNIKSVTAMQFALSKFEYDDLLNPEFKEGPFELIVDDISVY